MIAAGSISGFVREHIRRRLFLYILVCLSLAGGCVGGGMAADSVDGTGRTAIRSSLEEYFAHPVAALGEPGTDRLVYEALTGDVLPTAGLVWLLGLTIIGAPAILVVTFFRGFALGFTARFLVDMFQWRGGLLAAAALLPHNLLSLAGLVMAAVAGLRFASGAARILLGLRTEHTVYGQFASSFVLAAAGAVCILGARFVEAYVTPVLIDLTTQYLL